MSEGNHRTWAPLVNQWINEHRDELEANTIFFIRELANVYNRQESRHPNLSQLIPIFDLIFGTVRRGLNNGNVLFIGLMVYLITRYHYTYHTIHERYGPVYLFFSKRQRNPFDNLEYHKPDELINSMLLEKLDTRACEEDEDLNQMYIHPIYGLTKNIQVLMINLSELSLLHRYNGEQRLTGKRALLRVLALCFYKCFNRISIGNIQVPEELTAVETEKFTQSIQYTTDGVEFIIELLARVNEKDNKFEEVLDSEADLKWITDSLSSQVTETYEEYKVANHNTLGRLLNRELTGRPLTGRRSYRGGKRNRNPNRNRKRSKQIRK